MKIVQVVPGSGGTFYCPSCVRDGNMVRGLRALGHDVTVVPLYLPPETSDPDLATGRVSLRFQGGGASMLSGVDNLWVDDASAALLEATAAGGTPPYDHLVIVALESTGFFASSLGERLHATVIDKPVAIEDHFLDLLLQLGHQGPESVLLVLG